MKIKDKIMRLYDGKRTTREIAERVYGAPATKAQLAHVRVVARQRKGRGHSEIDKRWWATPRFKERNKEWQRCYRIRRAAKDAAPPPAVKKFLESIGA